MNTWGNKIRLSIFGESHGEAIGIVIDGLEAGTKLNLENINKTTQDIIYEAYSRKYQVFCCLSTKGSRIANALLFFQLE